ncbi:dihydrolipoyl dehydrogenase [Kerstersia similis]|uniref:dihydrolipoyl dehydrogenase n=1 Tax=Kerstersia similis TaxID=206505 RepID=UPI0039EEDA1C
MVRMVDVAVIGAGTAGLGAYRSARDQGASAVLIENGPFGTTCARVGCMPSKLLIAAADAAHAARDGAPFGVHVDAVRVDGAEVLARVRRERDRFVGFVLKGMESIPAGDILRGTARFTAPGMLAVGEGEQETQIQARAIVIATGSSPYVVESLAGLGDRLLINDNLFELADLPRSIAVFGPGVIGLELGQALHRLGVRTHLFGARGSLGGISDPAVKAAALAALKQEMSLDVRAQVQAIRSDSDGVHIRFLDDEGQAREEHFEYVLAATGRRPNLAALDLAKAGLTLDERGRLGYDRHTLRIGDSAVYIAGDANGDLQLLHEASDEGRIAGRNAARHPQAEPGLRRAGLSVVFSEPQIASAGRRYAELEQSGVDFVVGEVDFSDQGRARVMRRNAGLLRVYAQRSNGRLLGAELAAPAGEHLAHLLAWSVQQQMTIGQMLEMPFYHPVVEEGLRTALRDAHAKLAR